MWEGVHRPLVWAEDGLLRGFMVGIPASPLHDYVCPSSAEAFTIAMRSPTYIYAVLQMLTREEWLLCTKRSTMFLVVLDLWM